MKRLFVLLILLLSLSFYSTSTADAQEDRPEPDRGYEVCVFSRFLKPIAAECYHAGTSSYLERMAVASMTVPLRPFVYTQLDPSHAWVDFRYMRVRDDVRSRVPVYATLNDARNKNNPVTFFETNFTYITYQEVVDGFVLTDGGFWVSRGDVSPVAVPLTFSGLTFPSSPPMNFGWIFLTLSPRAEPGYSNPERTDITLGANEVVKIYETRTVDGVEWNQVGEEQWVEARLVNEVLINTTPPEGVTNGRWIEVNLAEQTLSVYDNRRLVFATVIATGIEPLFTRPGLFQIYKKLDAGPMSGSFEADRSDYYYLDNVPWTLYYDKARALHGAYWRTKLGHPQSHGCVNLSVGDASWVFNWANEGEWVYVWDPTGRTPTDPEFYGDGGA